MDLGTIALIFAAALLGPALSMLSRGSVPVVVGQLLAGVVLGKTWLGVVDPSKPELALLYTIGFATLMFMVGMHVPLHDKRLRGALRSGATATLVAAPLAVGAGLLARSAGHGPWPVYAVVLFSSSAAIALPVIDELGEAAIDQSILTAMAWITLADIVATLAIPLAMTPSKAGHAALGALIVSALVGAVFVFAHTVRDSSLVHRIRHESKKRQWALDLRLAVIVLVTLSWIAQKVGASVLVAGFGTGLVVGAIGGPKRLSKEVLGLGQGFLVPLFFVLLGAKLDLSALGNDVGLAVALAVLAVAVHVLVSIAIRAPLPIGLLATAQMGVPAAAIALGLQTHALDQGEASAIFCAALVSIGVCSVGAALLRRVSSARDADHLAANAPSA